jgi:hypothetical protein
MLDAFPFKDGGKKVGRALLVAGGIGGVNPKIVGEQSHRFVPGAIPIGLAAGRPLRQGHKRRRSHYNSQENVQRFSHLD